MTERFSDEVLKRADEAYSLALIGYEPMDHTQAASIERNRRACAAMRAVLEGHLAEQAPKPEQVALHEQYVVDHAADHDDDCPEDDTCACSFKPRNDAVNAACRYLVTGAASDGSPR